MRDNHIHRKGVGISASTLGSCPRAVVLEEKYPVYEPVISGYNKARGSWLHAMVEADDSPPSWLIREQRLYLDVLGTRITGKPDEVDPKYGILIDYKSKDNLPLRLDESHTLQFNTYAHLLRNGYWKDDDENGRFRGGDKANINVSVLAAHYLTWKTKAEKAWEKKQYPLWSNDHTQQVIEERLTPLLSWRKNGILPSCSPYIKNMRWKCQCEKWEEQLEERGIAID